MVSHCAWLLELLNYVNSKHHDEKSDVDNRLANCCINIIEMERVVDEDKLKAQVCEPRPYKVRIDEEDGSVVDW